MKKFIKNSWYLVIAFLGCLFFENWFAVLFLGMLLVERERSSMLLRMADEANEERVRWYRKFLHQCKYNALLENRIKEDIKTYSEN